MSGRSAITATLIFIAALGTILLSGRLEGDYRIDEVHKISETFFLRLIEQGAFGSPAWLESAVERTNPPAGKVLFGLALQLAGQPLPPDLLVAHLTESGRRLPPPEWDAQYRRWLLPARLVSAVVTAGSVALVFLAGSYACDAWGGLVCALLFSSNFLVATFAATAVFDPLLSFLILLSGLLSLILENQIAAGIFASLAAALAFNVRITGLLAWGACMLVFLLGRRLRAVAITAILFPVAAIALNPYYWVPDRQRTPLPLRIVSRLMIQHRDLRRLLSHEIATQGALDTLEKKSAFLFQYALGDWAGLTLLLGILCLIAAMIVARHRSSRAILTGVWSTAVALAILVWIPIPFPRYLLVATAPLALLGGMGWRFAATGVAEVMMNVSTSPRPNANGR